MAWVTLLQEYLITVYRYLSGRHGRMEGFHETSLKRYCRQS